MNLQEAIAKIRPVDRVVMAEAKKRLDHVAKPLNSLGLLEENLIRCAGVFRTSDLDLQKKCVVVMCADNGVTEQNITQSPSLVTALLAEQAAKKSCTVCKMAEAAGADSFVVDIGVARDIKTDGLIVHKLGYGTRDMSLGPAMSREQAEDGILFGIEMAVRLKEQGYRMIATGEMGIGNTSTSSACVSVLLDKPVEDVTGKGAGLSDKGIEHKIEVIKKAIAINKPDPADPIDVMAKIGGFDIAGMVGLFLGGAIAGVPVVIDGLISGVAAYLASMLAPDAVDYMLASHCTKEPGGIVLLEKLGLKPVLYGELCLGEGTGAVASFPLYDIMMHVYKNAATFDDLNMDAYVPQS